MSYQRFAQIYDNLMDDSLYPKWVEFVNRHLEGKETLVELGCGTGRLGIQLKKAGYEITGLDQSNEMLSIAYHHQLEEQTFFPLIEGDMRELDELQPSDAVLSFCDSLCYIEDKEDLKKVFSQVFHNLTDNGVFLFDVHSIFKIEQFKDFSYHTEIEEGFFVWDSFPGEGPHTIEHELTFFIESEDGRYERLGELHKERTYSIEEYQQMLKQAGFSKIEVSADFTEAVEEESERWFFVAKK